MTEIPEQLKREEFRFVLIPEGEKYPFEEDWQNSKNYQYDDQKLKKHLEGKNNYGVVCGYGNLTVIDADSKEVESAIIEKLPKTFVVQTGSGGKHFYYICPDLEDPIRLEEENPGDIGDVQSHGKQVVGPNSLHPSGNTYEIKIDEEIAKVPAEQIKFALKDFSKEFNTQKQKTKTFKTEFPISKVVDLSELKKKGKEYYGAHPVHGSDTGRNFWVNIEEDQWHCFRHDIGGGPLSLFAIQEGIIKCGSSDKNLSDREPFLKTIELADKKGLIDKDKFLGDDNKVEQRVELPSDTKAKIVIDSLHMKKRVVRGSLHVYINGNHRFEDDRKLSNQNLKYFASEVAELETLEEKDQKELYRTLVDMKDPARESALKESSNFQGGEVDKEILDVEDEKVDEFLENQPLVEFCDATNLVHQQDAGLKLLAWMSGLSRKLLDFPLNLWPVGSSGSGKTHALETVARTIPDEHVLKFDAASPKSMYYFCKAYGKDALDGKVVFFNEVEASEEAKELLRGLTDPTKEENRLLSVEDQEILDIGIEGLPVAWFTSVNPLDDMQLKNRFVITNPEEAADHKDKIAKHQKRNIQKGNLQPLKLYDFPIIKAGFRKILEETKDKEVLIPFDWNWKYAEDSRLQPFFGAFLMTSAKIHYKKRPILGDYIVATLADYYIAKIVFQKAIKETLSGVKEKDLELYEKVPELKMDAMTRSELAEKSGMSTSTIRHCLKRLTEADLINSKKQAEERGSPWIHWKSEIEFPASPVTLKEEYHEEEKARKKLNTLIRDLAKEEEINGKYARKLKNTEKAKNILENTEKTKNKKSENQQGSKNAGNRDTSSRHVAERKRKTSKEANSKKRENKESSISSHILLPLEVGKVKLTTPPLPYMRYLCGKTRLTKKEFDSVFEENLEIKSEIAKNANLITEKEAKSELPQKEIVQKLVRWKKEKEISSQEELLKHAVENSSISKSQAKELIRKLVQKGQLMFSEDDEENFMTLEEV